MHFFALFYFCCCSRRNYEAKRRIELTSFFSSLRNQPKEKAGKKKKKKQNTTNALLLSDHPKKVDWVRRQSMMDLFLMEIEVVTWCFPCITLPQLFREREKKKACFSLFTRNWIINLVAVNSNFKRKNNAYLHKLKCLALTYVSNLIRYRHVTSRHVESTHVCPFNLWVPTELMQST